MKDLARKALMYLSGFPALCAFSKKIVDFRQNENNCEIATNGELDFIRRSAEDFKVVFDVGANVGEWSELVSRITPGARIYAFEPSQKTFRSLSERLLGPNVSVHNIGFGEKNETKPMYPHEDDSTLTSVFSRGPRADTEGSRTESSAFETIDSFCAREGIGAISFLKIDTEGNELSVLKGAEKCISEGRINAIQFEYGGTYIDARILLKDVFYFFSGKPYSLFKMMRDRLEPCEPYTEDLENFQYANYVATLKK